MPTSAVKNVSSEVTSAVPSQVSRPYVGARPFERWERGIFFGRDSDARRLRDKILTSRLTLFYAQSGTGKSSLLKTSVIPYLEQEGAKVMYFDQWTMENPCEPLRTAFIERASQLGVSDAAAGTSSLAELGLRITAHDERPLVLILDQFEQFLISHANTLDPLRKELGGLVRASRLDVYVVLSVREEFLAALEPLRAEIMNLFQSTDMLKNLDDTGVREAIQRPAELFGFTYEPALLDRLLSDLRAEQAATSETVSRETVVSLTMMQLVCDQLWKIASTRDEKIVGPALYDELGGVHKILETYIAGVMPADWRDRYFTARLMKYLAPSSGYKKPYSAGELAEDEHLNKARVSQELNRLSTVGVLRQLDFRGQQLFELQHDSLIKFISPWREKVLRRARSWRRIAIVSVAALVVLTVAGAFALRRVERYKMTTGLLAELDSMHGMPPQERQRAAESRFDSATIYLLERERFNDLAEMLQKHEKDLPGDYGFANLKPTQTAISEENLGCEFLCLYYSSLRPIDSRYFNYQWQSEASRVFVEKFGVPVPIKLLLRKEALPKLLIRLTERSMTRVEFRMPKIDEKKEVFVVSETFRGEQGNRLRRFRDYLIEHKTARKIDTAHIIGESEADHSLWAVPSWSRPVWKTSGSPAINPSGLPALLLAWKLQQDPAPLFTDEAAALLLQRAREAYPDTVQQAKAVRGPNLTPDLVEMVKQNHGLTDLVAILDALAAYPDNKPQDAAKKADADLQKRRSDLAPKFGPLRSSATSATSETDSGEAEVPGAYQEIVPLLPPVNKPIRITLGSDLKSRWTDQETDNLSSDLTERVQALREEFFRHFGITIPEISFQVAAETSPLPPNAFRIENVSQHQTEVVSTQPTTALDLLMDKIKSFAEAGKLRWLLAEDVTKQRRRLAKTNPGLKSWLESRYSIAEQKELMRAVIAPPVVPKSATSGMNSSGPDTLRHQDWLLGSLVFWAQTSAARNGLDMANDLLRTQSARLERPAADADSRAVAPTIARGIRELQNGRIPSAEAAFAQAIKANRPAAEKAFLSAYPQSLSALELQAEERLCRDPEGRQSAFSQAEDLEEDLNANNLSLDFSRDQNLRLCLLEAYQQQPRTKRLEIEGEILRRYPNPGKWEPAAARKFAEEVLHDDDIDPYGDSTKLRDGAMKLLVGVVPRLSPGDATAVFYTALSRYKQPGPKDVKLQLLQELARVQNDPVTQLQFVKVLVGSEREQDLNHGFEILTGLKQKLLRKPISQNPDFWVDYAKSLNAVLLQRLSLAGIDRLPEAEALLQGLKNSRFEDPTDTAEDELAGLLLDRGAYKEAIELAQRALSRRESDRMKPAALEAAELNDTDLRLELLLAQLLLGQKPEARVTVQKTFDIAQKTAVHINNEPLFIDNVKQYADAEHAGHHQHANAILGRTLQLDVSYTFKAKFIELDSKINDKKASDRISKEMDDWTRLQKDEYPGLLFVSALGQIFTRSGDWEETARRFLETDHQYVPYLAMILSVQMSEAQAEEARGILAARWKQADPKHWPQRLRGGDEAAWREMLIGYYQGEVTREQIFSQLEDAQAYARSDLRFLPLARSSLLCEAYFYDALLARSKHDEARKKEDLEKVLKTNVKSYIEYRLAKVMLLEGAQQ